MDIEEILKLATAGLGIVGPGLSVFLALLSELLQKWAERGTKERISDVQALSALPGTPEDIARQLQQRVSKRIMERRSELQAKASAYSRTATLNRCISFLLLASNYGLGAVIASSFVQQTLDKKVNGWLGVLVILTTALYQRLRPDLVMVAAKHMVAKARVLLRTAEDELTKTECGAPDAMEPMKILEVLSRGLEELDHLEAKEANEKLAANLKPQNAKRRAQKPKKADSARGGEPSAGEPTE
jgi:hypothetical protein